MASVPIAFRTYHPQGMVKIGDTLFVSSVEVTVPTRRLSQPAGRYDRDAGEGVGHLFKLDHEGEPHRRCPTGGGHDLSPGRHRLRRHAHLGVRGRVSAGQPLDCLQGRPRDDEGDRDVALRRSHRRDRPQHRRPHAARRELGFAPLLSLDARRRRTRDKRRHAAGEAADAEPRALSGLSGLQVSSAAVACSAPA